MLMPMPVTIWLARSVLLRTACNNATGATATTPIRRPIAGFPVAQAPPPAPNAPVNIIPSMLMLSTPARSLTSSPVPARKSGTASRTDEPMNTANNSQVMAPSLALPDEISRAGERHDNEALNHHHQRGRNAGHHLHVDAARAQKAEQEGGGNYADNRTSRQQSGNETVETVARRKSVLEHIL